MKLYSRQARARLNTLMVAKPDKGKQVEAMLCQMAQSGQLGGKLGDDELKAWVYIFLKNPYISKARFMRCFQNSKTSSKF